jgi:phosphoribosyl 1,2-cyclic phosphodiesterase
LLTHEHQDHARAAKDLLKSGVDVYMSQGTAEALKLSGHRLHIIEAHKQFSIGPWAILPFETIHDAAEPLGFLASEGHHKILYVTDTCYVPYRFRGLTHILIEANYATDILNQNRNNGIIEVDMKRWIVKNHMSLGTVKGFLRANDLSRVREIHLLHLSDRNSDAARFKREIQALAGKAVYIGQRRSTCTDREK